LKNFKQPAASTVKASDDLIAFGQTWKKKCLNPACSGVPHWMHEDLTGTPLSAELRAKNAAFAVKKQEKASIKSTNLSFYLTPGSMTTCSTNDEDDYYAGKYMVFAARDISGTSSNYRSPFDDDQLLSDDCAGASLIKNKNLLTDIRRLVVPHTIEDWAELVAEYDGQLGEIGRFLYVPDAKANVLANCDCKRWGYRIELDDANDRKIIHTPAGAMVFTYLPGYKAHYACQIALDPNNNTVSIGATSVLVETVTGNIASHSSTNVKRAIAARKLLINLGMPRCCPH